MNVEPLEIGKSAPPSNLLKYKLVILPVQVGAGHNAISKVKLPLLSSPSVVGSVDCNRVIAKDLTSPPPALAPIKFTPLLSLSTLLSGSVVVLAPFVYPVGMIVPTI